MVKRKSCAKSKTSSRLAKDFENLARIVLTFVKAAPTNRDAAHGGELPCQYCIKYRQLYRFRTGHGFISEQIRVHPPGSCGIAKFSGHEVREVFLIKVNAVRVRFPKSLASPRQRLSPLGTKVALLAS
jgi:hypothetical protein